MNSIVNVIFDEISMSIFFHFYIIYIFRIFKTFNVNICIFYNNLFLDTLAFINFFLFRDRFDLHFALHYLHFYNDY